MAVFIGNQNVESAMGYNRAKYELIRLKAKEDIVLCSFHLQLAINKTLKILQKFTLDHSAK